MAAFFINIQNIPYKLLTISCFLEYLISDFKNNS
jgi:hypothetical protein